MKITSCVYMSFHFDYAGVVVVMCPNIFIK